MLVGVFGDAHITKNMRSLQSHWESAVIQSFRQMYNKFDEIGVDCVVGLGDFLDSPKLEAKHMQLVQPVLQHINESPYNTYLLLGNHEIDSDRANILEFLSSYYNIIPVTTLSHLENMVMIPYSEDPTTVPYKSSDIVFTHHDIYGSSLAGGKTKAFFGIDPDIFRDARLVMNGHVHLRSIVRPNVINAGSLLASSQGELRLGEYPQYYIIDTSTGEVTAYDNMESLIYLTVHIEEIPKVVDADYDADQLILKVEYSEELPENMINSLHTSYRKLITDISDTRERVAVHSNFDLKNYLKSYIEKDLTVEESKKSEYISTGLELLE